MARKPIINDLPSIQEAFLSFPGFKSDQSRRQILTTTLRNCAKNLQRDEPRPFYSMREVARHFSTPLRTTALAYETLDMEGLLHRIRGSQTMLAGKKSSSRQPINAIVGMPIWITSMITSPFECGLQMELEERLRSRGFVADSIFFRTGEDCDPDFAGRLLRHNLDILIWHSPHPLSTHVLMSLRERGVRLVLLQSIESPLRVPARNYVFDWQPAYHQMALQWRSSGIKRVIVPKPSHLLSRRAFKNLLPILESHKLEVLTVDADEKSLSSGLFKRTKKSLAQKTDVLAFMDAPTADSLCNGYPDLIEKISQSTHLAFCRGPVRIPRLSIKDINVDVVQLDPATLAHDIVEDLGDPQQTQEGIRQTFQAEYFPQIVMKSNLEQTLDR